jgi:hypothetical protein
MLWLTRIEDGFFFVEAFVDAFVSACPPQHTLAGASSSSLSRRSCSVETSQACGQSPLGIPPKSRKAEAATISANDAGRSLSQPRGDGRVRVRCRMALKRRASRLISERSLIEVIE